ncbi:MAG: Signal transduction histidine kinase [Sphingobacteriales bacterium]|nr:Signal transduction histidine kinase [Sphingobacteriales bacterium]
MISIRNISIKNKLVLMQVFTSVLVLGLCFTAFVITDIRGYKERKVNSTISIARVIGSNSISAIQFLDNVTAKEILKNLQNVEPDVINATLTDASRKTFANYTKPGFKPQRIDTSLNALQNQSEFSGNYLLVSEPITDKGEYLGTIFLQVEFTELEQIINQKLQITAILVLIGVGLAFLIAVINQRHISNPILSLVNIMKEIRESHEYQKQVEVKGKDEISTLSIEFNNLMQEVVRSHQKKDEFIGIASHELKTPLTSVKLYLESLSKMNHQQPTQLFIMKAREGVNKLHSLILDLLDVSKIQSGQLQLNLKELELENLVRECVQEAQMNNPRRLISLEIEAGETIVMADKDRLEQVIINFLSNAVKYSPEDKNIVVKAFQSKSSINVSITDFGIGIAPSEHAKIFERFYRATDSNSVISGFGLGLYICQQIIKRHHGTIGVESNINQGSTFYFEIPILKSHLKTMILAN